MTSVQDNSHCQRSSMGREMGKQSTHKFGPSVQPILANQIIVALKTTRDFRNVPISPPGLTSMWQPAWQLNWLVMYAVPGHSEVSSLFNTRWQCSRLATTTWYIVRLYATRWQYCLWAELTEVGETCRSALGNKNQVTKKFLYKYTTMTQSWYNQHNTATVFWFINCLLFGSSLLCWPPCLCCLCLLWLGSSLGLLGGLCLLGFGSLLFALGFLAALGFSPRRSCLRHQFL